MVDNDWVEEFPGGVYVCDRAGTILRMNRRAVETCRDRGGAALVGTDVKALHEGSAGEKLASMLETGKRNVWLAQGASGVKLIYQSPWYRDGTYTGFVELALDVELEELKPRG